MIEFKGVSYNYGAKFDSLHDFSYCFEAGNYALIGDYVEGNLTVIRLLAKFDTWFKGEILIDGKSIKKIDYKHINIGYLSQKPVFFESKSVLDNLIYPLKSRKIKKSVCTQKCMQALNNFGWENRANEKVKTLSQTDKLILSIIRVSLRELDILLCEDIFDVVGFDILSKISARTTILALNTSPAPPNFTELKFKLGEYLKNGEVYNSY